MQITKWCVVGLALSTGLACSPDRQVTDPDAEILEARRPSVLHTVPKSGSVAVPVNASISVWFDEEMNQASVAACFHLYPYVQADSLTASAIDPARPDFLYVGKANGGILRSTNGGKSWKWMTMSFGRLNVTALAISPSDPNVLYAGTTAGVLKSTDAGVTWSAVNNGLTDLAVSGLCVDRQQSTKVFVSTLLGGVFSTVSGGSSWTPQNNGLGSVIPVLGQAFMDIAMDPVNGNILYLATRNSRMYKSTDGGAAWVILPSSPRSVRRIVVAPGNSRTIYAGTVLMGLYRSFNAGTNWSAVNTGLGDLDIYAVAVRAQDSLTVYVGTPTGMYRTLTGGASWLTASSGLTEGVSTISCHPSVPGFVLAGSTANVYSSLDGGSSFTVPGGVSRIYSEGSAGFASWRDSLTVISRLSESGMDTTVIVPYTYARALSAWIAGGRKGDPPVETNPVATMMIFTPVSPLLPGWNYQIRITGTFESDGLTPQGERGAEDIHGNSLLTDKVVNFSTQ